MRTTFLALFIASAAGLGCGTTSTSPGDASADAAAEASGNDSGLDASDGGGCGAGCRLVASYCSTAPCKCVSLPSSEPDPTCDAGTVSCSVDPCQGKTAACVADTCVVQ